MNLFGGWAKNPNLQRKARVFGYQLVQVKGLESGEVPVGLLTKGSYLEIPYAPGGARRRRGTRALISGMGLSC